MPDPITGTVAAIGGSSVLGGIGASKQASAQKDATQQELQLYADIYEANKALLEPFRLAGVDALGGLSNLSTPEGQAAFYDEYYRSPQYQAIANQAQNQQLAAAEATGGLQSTSTQNQLARIAPELGLQALNQQTNLLGNLTNIGLSGAGSQAGFGQTYSQQAGGALGDLGAINAAQAGIPYQVGGQLLNFGANVLGGGLF